MENYKLYRKDRESGSGGGVLLYIHNSLPSIICQALSNLEIQESLWCLVTLNRADVLLVGLIYRSPNSTVENNEKIPQAICNLYSLQKFSHLLLVGDFNLPDID